MKILSINNLPIAGVKSIRFAKFMDGRGYFTEPYRQSDLSGAEAIPELSGLPMVQTNESVSRSGVIRGLHFQWNPFMGKLVRTISGHMIDIILDIRLKSPTRGKAIFYDMPARDGEAWDEWIWVPPGMAHGNLFLKETRIEYLCSGEYSPGCEAGINPHAQDIDWSLAEPALLETFRSFGPDKAVMSDKDKQSMDLKTWFADPRAAEFDFSDFKNVDK